METFAAAVAALINLLAIALYHDKQATVLNGTAAAFAHHLAARLAPLARSVTPKLMVILTGPPLTRFALQRPSLLARAQI